MYTAVWNWWTGLRDWNTGLEYWNGLNCYKKPFSRIWQLSRSKQSGYSLMCSMPCLGVLPQSLGDWRSCTYLISFSQRLDSDIQLVLICAFCKALVITQMYLCLTVSMAGCLCPFSGSSKWNVCRPRNTLVVCKYTSTYLQHVDGWSKRTAFLKIA